MSLLSLCRNNCARSFLYLYPSTSSSPKGNLNSISLYLNNKNKDILFGLNAHMREELDTHAGAASVRVRSKHRSRVLLKTSMVKFAGSGCGVQQLNSRFNTEACAVGQ